VQGGIALPHLFQKSVSLWPGGNVSARSLASAASCATRSANDLVCFVRRGSIANLVTVLQPNNAPKRRHHIFVPEPEPRGAIGE
jgi:hypothetical protein